MWILRATRDRMWLESVLQQALGNNRYESMDDKVANVNLSRLGAGAYVDYANYSYRLMAIMWILKMKM